LTSLARFSTVPGLGRPRSERHFEYRAYAFFIGAKKPDDDEGVGVPGKESKEDSVFGRAGEAMVVDWKLTTGRTPKTVTEDF
jgi:hypothetical protein